MKFALSKLFFDIYFSFFEKLKINLFEFYSPCIPSLSLLKKHVSMMNTDVQCK